MSGASTIPNAYIAQGFALAGAVVFALLYTFADATGTAYVFQVPALAAAFVVCLWSLLLSIRAVAITGKWWPSVIVWILVACELNVPAAYTWILLLNSSSSHIGVWTTGFCNIGLPVFAPLGTVIGLAFAVTIYRYSRRRAIVAAIIILINLVIVAPVAFYGMAVNTLSQQPFSVAAWNQTVVEYSPNCMKNWLDRYCFEPTNQLLYHQHATMCEFGYLPRSRLYEIILNENEYVGGVAFGFLTLHDPAGALEISEKIGRAELKFRSDRSVQFDGMERIGRYFGANADCARLRSLFSDLNRAPFWFKRSFLDSLSFRPDGHRILEEAITHTGYNRDSYYINALAVSFLVPDHAKCDVYDAWQKLWRSATNEDERMRPLFTLDEKSRHKDVRVRRAAVFVLADTLKITLEHTPFPDDESPETAAEAAEAASVREQLHKLIPGQKLVEALKGEGDVPLIAWQWLVERYPTQAIGVAGQIAKGAVRFHPQLDADAALYFGRKAPAEQIRALLKDPKSLTYTFLTNLLNGIGAERRPEFIPDLKALSEALKYLHDDIAAPLYQLEHPNATTNPELNASSTKLWNEARGRETGVSQP